MSAPPVMLLQNLPTDRALPDTPTDGGAAKEKQTFISEGVLLALSTLLGEPVSFRTEKNGRIIHDIATTKGGADTQTSQASKVFLNFHNDIVYDENDRYDVSNPDFLVLYCLRGAPGGAAGTYYCAASEIIEFLPPETVATLRDPRFKLNAPGGYTKMYANNQAVWSLPMPLIVGPPESPEIFLAANGVIGIDETAQRALDSVQELCRSGSIGARVELTPGDALLINNRKGVHARDPFPARFDGTDRWLQRTYIRRSLWNIRDKAVDGRLHR
ncbi:TauD/TfdA family dioxygenase [Rhodococcus sp. IEGM 1330]|uniref:TauD/TfdA family dioxygenase n=1 Tax=Rhodococcus sp. IEGM 1330 TaxID=3082225 RepID=UPI002953C70C|nr:TauD/TfdA family dioxygenase [Rhodococcus sp. IEGM 1330]MDV8022650.1 TauD/TfdA family dioxygenase [Rhodococcus sp. IEGM 1330]